MEMAICYHNACKFHHPNFMTSMMISDMITSFELRGTGSANSSGRICDCAGRFSGLRPRGEDQLRTGGGWDGKAIETSDDSNGNGIVTHTLQICGDGLYSFFESESIHDSLSFAILPFAKISKTLKC